MVKEVTKFYSDDGKEFDTLAEAKKHEEDLLGRAEINYRKFINHSYSGQQLLKEHALSDYGTWEIKGEDSNADLGGHHYQPSLGFFEGTLEQVIRKAVSIPRFYTWGGGGNIIHYSSPLVEKL